MPRNVRNFLINIMVDGKERKIEAGPVSKDGGFNISILMRDRGEISQKSLCVRGRALSDGSLKLSAWMAGNERNEEIVTVTQR